LLTRYEALERATYSSKSFLIGLALVLEEITVEEAALASAVEVASQIERWGEVEDCKSVQLAWAPLTSASSPRRGSPRCPQTARKRGMSIGGFVTPVMKTKRVVGIITTTQHLIHLAMVITRADGSFKPFYIVMKTRPSGDYAWLNV